MRKEPTPRERAIALSPGNQQLYSVDDGISVELVTDYHLPERVQKLFALSYSPAIKAAVAEAIRAAEAIEWINRRRMPDRQPPEE